MNKLSMFSLAGAGGALAFLLTVSGPADAAISGKKFRASADELRRHCWRIEEPFWTKKRQYYGCGERIGCKNGVCKVYVPPPPPPPPPPPLYSLGGDNGGDGGKGGKGGDRGGDNGGNGNGGQGSSSAGGPN